VPPPPAPGAPVRLGVGLAAEFGVGECVAPPVAPPVAVAPAEEPALPLPPALPVAPPETAPLAEVADVGGVWVAAGGVEVEDPEHPATATVRMAKTPKLLAACFALSTVPAMVTRTVM
jgi:hypothetical protein